LNLAQMKKVSSALNFFMVFSDTYQRINKRMDSGLTVHGLSIIEFMVLHQLYIAPGKTMSRVELANSVGLTASGITRLLNPLDKLHLVDKQKNARDARVSLVKLSKTGEKIYYDALTTCNTNATSFFDSVTDKQMNNLAELFTKIRLSF